MRRTNSSRRKDSTKATTNKVTLRGCSNHRAKEMTPCCPWDFQPRIPRELIGDKLAYGKWCQEVSTQHLFFHATEGVNPNLRPSNLNPVRRMHGLIADYDAVCSSDMIASLSARGPLPNWAARTFSDGARLLWLFEEPVPMENEALRKQFLKIAAKELQLVKLLPGLDEKAWFDVCKVYDVGRDWKAIAVSPLPITKIYAMLEEASRQMNWSKESAVIPIETIAEEVERRYPGRWDGEFEVGKRGVAFFDPRATNPTAAIVTESGMVCFSQEKIFYTWSDIFGPDFVKKFNEDRIGGATAGTFYDGRWYWRKDNRGVFVAHSKDAFVIKLKVEDGLHASKGRFESHSEVDQALHFIHEHARVDGAIPRLYCQDDIFFTNGKRFVNSSTVKVMQPAEIEQEWGKNFPWLAEFFEKCWDQAPVQCVIVGQPPACARDIFFAWFKRFYTSALQGRLLKGQALFNVGPVDSGKTLLSLRIVGDAMGACAEGSDFLGGGTTFNRELIDSPIWNIDDGTMNSDPASHQKFSETIKRAVANPYFSYHPKFFDQQRAEWLGRVIVTLNSDATSVRMIPNLDASLEDKIIVLKFADETMRFGADVEQVIRRELPFFLRWLLDWEVPAHVVGENRFGIKAFIHENIRVAAISSSDTGDILEIVESWVNRSGPSLRERHGPHWHGTATEWVTDVSGDDQLKALVSKFTPRTIGRRFSEASRIRGTRIKFDPSTAKLNGNRYFISLEEDGERQKKSVRVRLKPMP
jgi:hypothetical protein